MRDTIDMAREVYGAHTEWAGAPLDRLEQLVALVRADERADCERVVGIALLGAEMDLAKRVLRAIRARSKDEK
jgi:hypothetical protein